MKEPEFGYQGVFVPYSKAPSDHLRLFAGKLPPRDPEFYNPEFRRIYAAILLRERGL